MPNPPRVYIDTCILKHSSIALRRLRPRQKRVAWGDKVHTVTVHDLVTFNPNDRITDRNLKVEVDLLSLLAEAGKLGEVKYVIQSETRFESWGLRNMDSVTDKFYGVPLEEEDPPIYYERCVLGFLVPDPKQAQFDFLTRIQDRRFLQLQRMTGAYQGKKPLVRRQLLDAWHLWCAEHNSCEYFLTTDFALIRTIANNKAKPNVSLVKPSELIAALRGATRTRRM